MSEIKNGEKPKVGISSSAFYFTGKFIAEKWKKNKNLKNEVILESYFTRFLFLVFCA